MSIIKINQLPASTGLTSDDLLMVMDNPNGTQITQNITLDSLRNSILNQAATLQFRQGLDSERQLITPASAEPIWTTDNKKLYIGDGSTVGGIPVGSAFVETTSGNINTLSVFSNNSISSTGTTLNTVAGGTSNFVSSNCSYNLIGGGISNSISGTVSFPSDRSSILGGASNLISNSTYSQIVGGLSNSITTQWYQFIGGGYQNFSRGSYNVICGGYQNIGSGSSIFIGGGSFNNIDVSTQYGCILGGQTNSILTNYSSIIGGAFNTTSGIYSSIIGGARAKTGLYGEIAHAGGNFASPGDAQHSILVCRVSTADATANVLLNANGGTTLLTNPTATLSRNFLYMIDRTAINFEIKITAYNDTDSAAAMWNFYGGAKRASGANTVSFIGTPTSGVWQDAAMTGTSVNLFADTTNGGILIRVNGLAGKTIRWVGVIDYVQTTFGTP